MAREFVALGALTAVLAYALTPLTARLARVLGAIDEPDPRRVNVAPVPRIGGLAIFAALLCAVAASPWLAPKLWATFGHGDWRVFGAAAVLIFALGIADDIRPLSVGSRLVCQILAAIAVSLSFAGASTFGFAVGPSGCVLAIALTSLWIATITNASNLIDGLDGLSVGVAMIESAGLIVLAALRHQTPELVVLCLIGAALVGFWMHNRYPARIFPGDGGALLIGFLLATLALRVNSVDDSWAGIAVPILILAYPELEVGLTLVRRFLRAIDVTSGGERGVILTARRPELFRPDRDHIHHRLLKLGLSHPRAVHACWLFSAGMVALGILTALSPGTTALAIGLAAVSAGVAGRELGYRELRIFARGLLIPLSRPLTPRSRRIVDFLAMVAGGLTAQLIVRGNMPSGALVACAVAQAVFIAASGIDRDDYSHPDLESCLGLAAVGVGCGLMFALVVLAFGEPRWALGGGLADLYLAMTWLAITRLGLTVLKRIYERSSSAEAETRRAVIYGAGAAGRMLIYGSSDIGGRLLGLIDDDPALQLRRYNGVRVIGDFTQLEVLIAAGRVDEVIISTQKLERPRRQKLAEACRKRRAKLSQFKIAMEPLPEAVVVAQRYAPVVAVIGPRQVSG
jgi:UDP-GlcNAc:undecaprenyl-phosphate GlcNAc-1-phosphate transferase